MNNLPHFSSIWKTSDIPWNHFPSYMTIVEPNSPCSSSAARSSENLFDDNLYSCRCCSTLNKVLAHMTLIDFCTQLKIIDASALWSAVGACWIQETIHILCTFQYSPSTSWSSLSIDILNILYILLWTWFIMFRLL